MKQFKVVNGKDSETLEKELNQAANEGFEFLTALPYGPTGHMAAILAKEESTPATASTSNS